MYTLAPATISPLRTANAGTAHSLRSFGHVEVLRITRRNKKDSPFLQFKGKPGSKNSSARSVRVSFTGTDDERRTPRFDKNHERIHLYYSSLEHPEVQLLITEPDRFMCYFWTSFDGAHSHAWLLHIR